MAHGDVGPVVNGHVGDSRDLVEGLESDEPAAVGVFEECQEVDDRVRRQLRHLPEHVRHRQAGRVGEVEPALELPELCARLIRVEAVLRRHPAHHEHVAEIRMELDRDVDRAFQIERRHHAGRIRSGSRAGSIEHDRRARAELVSVSVHEVEHGLGSRDDHVEGLAGILPAEKVTERQLVVRLGKSRDVQVFGVVVEASRKAVVENGSNGPVQGHRDRRIAARADEDEDGFLGGLGGRNRAHYGHQRTRDQQRRNNAGSSRQPGAGDTLHDRVRDESRLSLAQEFDRSQRRIERLRHSGETPMPPFIPQSCACSPGGRPSVPSR